MSFNMPNKVDASIFDISFTDLIKNFKDALSIPIGVV
jgi:hypothetical protein